jgi:hypothetical protein
MGEACQTFSKIASDEAVQKYVHPVSICKCSFVADTPGGLVRGSRRQKTAQVAAKSKISLLARRVGLKAAV